MNHKAQTTNFILLIGRNIRVLVCLMILILSGCNTDWGDLGFDINATIPPDSIFSADSHYIVVIGDVQEYTSNNHLINYLKRTCKWVKSQQDYFGVFSCVLQNGDLTNTNNPKQWKRANEGMAYLGDSILWIPVTGNHDYAWNGQTSDMEITERESSLINDMLDFHVLRNMKIQQYEAGKFDNIIVPVGLGCDTINIIALEFGPRKEAVTWVDSVVKSNPGKRYILMTHEWMDRDGNRLGQNSYADLQFPNLSHSNPQEIWEKLIYPNDNILCVLCGHNGFCKYLFSTNEAGREVCQILFNLQYQKNGGEGMIQLWEFPKTKDAIIISVFNTVTGEFHPDPETSIRIKL